MLIVRDESKVLPKVINSFECEPADSSFTFIEESTGAFLETETEGAD